MYPISSVRLPFSRYPILPDLVMECAFIAFLLHTQKGDIMMYLFELTTHPRYSSVSQKAKAKKYFPIRYKAGQHVEISAPNRINEKNKICIVWPRWAREANGCCKLLINRIHPVQTKGVNKRSLRRVELHRTHSTVLLSARKSNTAGHRYDAQHR